MADEKSKNLTGAEVPDVGPAPVQPEAGGGAPTAQQEQTAPEAAGPDKAKAPEQTTPVQPDKAAEAPKEEKAASVSVFNFSEIMAEKKAAEKAGGTAGTAEGADSAAETPGPPSQGRKSSGSRTKGGSQQEG